MDNKYKSISSILREMSVNRNTELRKKVVNVGRPDTATDPTDVKSKLAKQGEIKTKIIDEDHYIVHVDDGRNYGDKPHNKDVEHVETGLKIHRGEHAGQTDKGVMFKFKSHDDANRFTRHVNSKPRSMYADEPAHMKEETIDEVIGDVGPNQGPLDEITVGDTVHAGFGKKGGAGFKGKVHKVEGDDIHINIGKGKYGDRIVKAPKRLVTKEEVVVEASKATLNKIQHHQTSIDALRDKIDQRMKSGDKGGYGYNDSDEKELAHHKKQLRKLKLSNEETVVEASVSAINKDDIETNKKDVDAPTERKKDKKTDSNKDAVDAKEIKGGKTEVDLNPRTNDNVGDQEKESKDSKKARNAANKEIGAKGMKEETTMFKSDKTFGLPQGLLDSVKKVLDEKSLAALAPPHDKVTKKDVLVGRGVLKKHPTDPSKHVVAKEEVEEIDELSIQTMKSAKDKLADKAVGAHYDDNKAAARNYAGRALRIGSKIKRKQWQAAKAAKTNEEVEQIDELSPATMSSYVKKAVGDVRYHSKEIGHSKEKGEKPSAEDLRKSKNRAQGISTAATKLAKEEVEKNTKPEDVFKFLASKKGPKVATRADLVKKDLKKEPKKVTKEEVEQVEEGNIENKEKKNAAVEKIGFERMKKTGAFPGQSPKRTGRAVTKEEVEFSAEELARIEAIAKDME